MGRRPVLLEEVGLLGVELGERFLGVEGLVLYRASRQGFLRLPAHWSFVKRTYWSRLGGSPWRPPTSELRKNFGLLLVEPSRNQGLIAESGSANGSQKCETLKYHLGS